MWRKLSVSMLMLLLATGCADRIELDNSSLIAISGIDIAKGDKLQVTGVLLDFNEESTARETVVSSSGDTMRGTRLVFGAKSGGVALAGKLQIILLSNEFLKKREIMPVLDVIYRDSKVSNNAMIIACECTVRDLMEKKWENQPILTEYLRKLIVSGNSSEMTVKTSIQKLHYYLTEPGVTASISVIRPLHKEIIIVGSTLLDRDGKYVVNLDREESALLLLLKKECEPSSPYKVKVDLNGKPVVVNFEIKDANPKVKVSYENERFQFRISIGMQIELTEISEQVDLTKDMDAFQRLVNEQLQMDFNNFFQKLQKNHVDPIGYGLYAKAFQYKKWSDVKDHWGEAFAQSEIEVTTKVKVEHYGVID